MQSFKCLWSRYSLSFINSRKLPVCCLFSYQTGIKTDRILHNNLRYPMTFERYESTAPAKTPSVNVQTSGKGTVQQILLRGKAATSYQETILNDFITTKEEATPEEWKTLIDKIFELNFGLINETNINAKIMEACIFPKNLALARNYLNYMKHCGQKMNAATATNFLKVCYECESWLIDIDKARIEQFVNTLLTKYKLMDAGVADGIVKGLIILGKEDKAFEIVDNLKELVDPSSSTYTAVAICLLRRDESERALKYIEQILERRLAADDKFHITWIEVYKNDKHKLDRLLLFWREHNIIPKKIVCDHLCFAYGSLPIPQKLEGEFGCITNQGLCEICNVYLNRVDLTQDEFDSVKSEIFSNLVVGSDIFKNSSPQELTSFFNTVKRSAPFDVVIDGLNVAYMAGTNISSEIFTSFIKNTIKHFHELDHKVFLIGRKHMRKWKNFVRMLEEYKTNYFFIDDVSEDDPYLIYATMYSGLNTWFVTRDLLRSEKYYLTSEKSRALFKRWQQSHQIFIQYVAPSGRVYCRTPILFQMEVQQSSTGGWHVPYRDDHFQYVKEEYGIHREWLCLRNKSETNQVS